LDFLILGDLRELLQCNIALLQTYRILADEEAASIAFTLDNYENSIFIQLTAQFDLQVNNFNSSCMIFHTHWLDATIRVQLNELTQRCIPINHHTAAEHGTDQPILNLFFYGQWGQLKRVSYFTAIKPDTLAAHTMRWRAPWSHYAPLYRRNTQLFRIQAASLPRPIVQVIAPIALDRQHVSFLQDTAAWPINVVVARQNLAGDAPFTLLMAHPHYLPPLWDMLLIESLLEGTICTVPFSVDNFDVGPKKIAGRQRLFCTIVKFGHSLFVHKFALIRWVMLRLFLRKIAQRFTDWCESKLVKNFDIQSNSLSSTVCMVNTAWLYQFAKNTGRPMHTLTPQFIIAQLPPDKVKLLNVFASSSQKLIVDTYVPPVWREPHLYEHLRMTGLKTQSGLYELKCAKAKSIQTAEPLSPAPENP
jgi:hypothetical protein